MQGSLSASDSKCTALYVTYVTSFGVAGQGLSWSLACHCTARRAPPQPTCRLQPGVWRNGYKRLSAANQSNGERILDQITHGLELASTQTQDPPCERKLLSIVPARCPAGAFCLSATPGNHQHNTCVSCGLWDLSQIQTACQKFHAKESNCKGGQTPPAVAHTFMPTVQHKKTFPDALSACCLTTTADPPPTDCTRHTQDDAERQGLIVKQPQYMSGVPAIAGGARSCGSSSARVIRRSN